jgi:hypothetical protein
MATPYFHETQRLRDNPWILVLISGSALAALIPLLYGIYWQIGQGIQWGNTPMGNRELIGMTVVVSVSMSLMVFLVVNLRLEVKIDVDGIHYRMFPSKWRWRLVRPSEIEEYKFADRFKLFETGGIGHHRSIFKNMRSFRISGRKHMTLKFKDGHRLLLGTQDLSGLEWGMKKLMNKTIA